MYCRKINHKRWFEESDKFMNLVPDGIENSLFIVSEGSVEKWV